jgi:hypothetical protein
MLDTDMQMTTSVKKPLLSLVTAVTPTNDFRERYARILNWKPLELAVQGVYPANTGSPSSCVSLSFFQMSSFQHGHVSSGPQDEEMVCNALNWRRLLD